METFNKEVKRQRDGFQIKHKNGKWIREDDLECSLHLLHDFVETVIEMGLLSQKEQQAEAMNHYNMLVLLVMELGDSVQEYFENK